MSRILLVDDEVIAREVIGAQLEQLGHTVFVAASAEEAKAAFSEYSMDMALVDLRLGDQSGLDLLPVFREQAPDCQIVLITAYASVESAAEAMCLGASDYLVKPVEHQDLLRAVQRCMEHKKVLEENRRLDEENRQYRDHLEEKVREQAAEIRESEEYFRAIFESIQDLYYRTDMDGRVTSVSPSCLALTGYTPEEVMGVNVASFYADPGQRNQFLEQIRKHGSVNDFEIELVHKKGDHRITSVASHLVFDQEHHPVAVEGIMRDITERKQTEASLQESENRYRNLIETLPDSIIVHCKGEIVYANPSALSLLGANHSKKLIGRQFMDLVPPDLRDVVLDRVRGAEETGMIQPSMEETLLRLDGSSFVAQVVGIPITYEGERAVQVVLCDITGRKKAEEALAEKQAQHNEAQRIAHLGHWTLDLVKDELIWSDENYRIFGVEPGMANTYQTFLKIVHPDDYAFVDRAYTESVKNNTPYDIEHRLLMADGSIKWINERCETEYAEDGMPLRSMGTTLDITERKRLEDKLEESRKRLKTITDSAPDYIFQIDLNGLITYVNRPAPGKKLEDMLGTNMRQWMKPESHTQLEKTMDMVISSKVTGEYESEGIVTGHYYSSTISPVIVDGHVQSMVLIAHDITEHKLMEEEFRQAQKMEALGTLVGGIAHDFNNMLAGMSGNLYLAKRKVKAMPDVVEKLGNIEKLVSRAAGMISQLMAFARKDMLAKKEFSMGPFVKEAIRLCRVSVPENIILKHRISSDSLMVSGDTTQIQQMLLNLISNARDAVDGVKEPVINIRLKAFTADEAFLLSHTDVEGGQFAHLSISDNGCGIPEEQLDKIFEPFFTTKGVGKGTGLGLSMIYGSIKTHHGIIDVESVVGKGTTFHLYLPLIQGASPTGDVAERQSGALNKGHGETILLADDDEHVRKTGKEVLESLGYRVLTASHGREAVDLFITHRDEVALAILDVVMPEMGGAEAAKKMRGMRPDLPIIFASGYDEKHTITKESEKYYNLVLKKPFSVTLFSQSVHSLLEASK